MAVSDIGSTDTTALLCHTNRPPHHGLHHSGGDWFAPNGVRLAANARGLQRTRGPMVVRLQRASSGTPEDGIYRCSVQDNTSNYHSVHVGIYNNGGGK